MSRNHLYLVDGSGYIFRAYHQLPPLTNRHGTPVGAVYGYTTMLWKLADALHKEEGPTHLAVVLDKGSHTFRNDLYGLYKANRPPPPEDLIPQFAVVREATRAFGVSCIELPGYEADDVIATVTREAVERGIEVVIVTSDKDARQLLGPKVRLFNARKNSFLDEAFLMEDWGVRPDQVVDFQSLVGDSVDNVPGAPGIGVKTASALINEYGDLDTLLARAGEIKQDKRRQTLIDFADQIRLSRALVTLDCDTPLPEPAACRGRHTR